MFWPTGLSPSVSWRTSLVARKKKNGQVILRNSSLSSSMGSWIWSDPQLDAVSGRFAGYVLVKGTVT